MYTDADGILNSATSFGTPVQFGMTARDTELDILALMVDGQCSDRLSKYPLFI